MVQLSSINMAEMNRHQRKPLSNIPWKKDSVNESFSPINLTRNISLSDAGKTLRYSVFLKELTTICNKFNISKHYLKRALKRFRNVSARYNVSWRSTGLVQDTLEHQFIMIAMSNLGEFIYMLSCCVARANTTYGDFEVRLGIDICAIENRVKLFFHQQCQGQNYREL